MKLFFTICLFALFILNSQPGFSQKEVEISGVKYLLHTVKKGETAFSLCQKYNITQNGLIEANPGMTAILKAGSTVKIPIKNEVAEQKPEPGRVNAVVPEPEFYYHKVNKNQTILSITRQYGISANDLIRFNPEITNGLVVGQVLKVPVKAEDSADTTVQSEAKSQNLKTSNSEPPSEDGFIFHSVVAGETLYALGQKYGVTQEELIVLNPFLEKGLQTGTKLKIRVKNNISNGIEEVTKPKLTEVVEKQTETVLENCIPIVGKNAKKYNVGLLLPLYLQGNDKINSSDLNSAELLSKIDFSKTISKLPVIITDSTAVFAGANIDQRAESFLEFYEGALLAIDSLQEKGMNIELYVFDVTNQTMINGLLQLEVFRDLDLIIGPVYPELQESVASFAAKNRIPMVSPLASNGNFEESNSYYFKVNPTREYQIEQTAKYIADKFNDKNFILLPMTGGSNSAEAKLAGLGKEKLLATRQLLKNKKDLFHEYSFQNQGLTELNPLLDPTGENVFIIPTDNEAQVSVAVTNLNALAENFDVVLIGTSNLTKLKSIQTENYHHVRLRYLSPTFIDYTKPLVRRFIGQYRETFSDEPSQFSYQGFDVAYYFLSALFRYGKDFRSCLPSYPMELTQTDFSFGRVTPMGGYMNQGLFVTAYERNYDILNYGTLVGK
jgi:LysM repeat protein/ABC-type branched-subunit amino acid transport system substrate-binding protein